MKWISLGITSLCEIAIVCAFGFMHQATAIVSFLSVLLLVGWIVQESREDMPERPKSILSGFMFGTYAAAVVISLLVYKKYILI